MAAPVTAPAPRAPPTTATGPHPADAEPGVRGPGGDGRPEHLDDAVGSARLRQATRKPVHVRYSQISGAAVCRCSPHEVLEGDQRPAVHALRDWGRHPGFGRSRRSLRHRPVQTLRQRACDADAAIADA